VPTKASARPRAAKVGGDRASGGAGTVRQTKPTPDEAASARRRARPGSPGVTKTHTTSTRADKKSATKETVSTEVISTPRTAKDAAATPAARSTRAPASEKNGAAAGKKPPARRASAAPAGPYAQDDKFLAEQRQLLETERAVYLAQASDLKAEADSLAQEREPGDVQFDEESGEGGTVTVDRERDLALSAQALAAVEEIDAALAKIADRTYGACERCQQAIPKPRLKALPYARLCVACKSGGLSRR